MQLSGIMRYKIEQLPSLTPPLRRGSTRQDPRGGNRASAKPMTGVCHPKAIRICFRLEQFKEVS